MTRDEAIALMSCHTCGDLEPHVLRELDQLIAADPELAAMSRQLRAQNERVGQLLVLRTAPDTLRDPHAAPEPPSVEIEPPGHSSNASLLAAGLALVAAALLAVALVWGLSPVPPEADLHAAAVVHAAAVGGQLVSVDPLSPDPGFEAAGVPTVVRMVPDLSAIGLTIQGVYVLPGDPPGAGIAYSDGAHVYLCQMWLTLATPDRAVAERDVAGLRLRGYRDGDVSMVVWSDGRFVCVMTSDVPLDDLLALVERRIAATG